MIVLCYSEGCPNLGVVNVSWCQITDHGLEAISRCTKLHAFICKGCVLVSLLLVANFSYISVQCGAFNALWGVPVHSDASQRSVGCLCALGCISVYSIASECIQLRLSAVQCI